MSIAITTHGPFREGREKEIRIDYKNDMRLREVVEILNIDPDAIGIVKINDTTGLLKNALDMETPDGSRIDFLPYLAGG
ncbi:MAG: MoaD/ThiS family protein [Proteobacteria bacterium]|nr:MoaD/ThiS family protein [Pseudomonadota bacterium]